MQIRLRTSFIKNVPGTFCYSSLCALLHVRPFVGIYSQVVWCSGTQEEFFPHQRVTLPGLDPNKSGSSKHLGDKGNIVNVVEIAQQNYVKELKEATYYVKEIADTLNRGQLLAQEKIFEITRPSRIQLTL